MESMDIEYVTRVVAVRKMSGGLTRNAGPTLFCPLWTVNWNKIPQAPLRLGALLRFEIYFMWLYMGPWTEGFSFDPYDRNEPGTCGSGGSAAFDTPQGEYFSIATVEDLCDLLHHHYPSWPSPFWFLLSLGGLNSIDCPRVIAHH